MEITVKVPDELAGQLRPIEAHLAHILELGLREWIARQGATFAGLSAVLETLASLPTPEEVLALRPSAAMQMRLEELLEKSQSIGLSEVEEREWEQYRYVEHLVRMAKARAAIKRQGK